MNNDVMPRARQEGLLVEQVDEEAVVYDVETREAHCLKPLAAAVFELCDGTTAVQAVAAAASAKLGEPVNVEQVGEALEQLDECGLLMETATGTSRREMIRRTATVATLAASGAFITSLALPATALAASCHLGASCTTDSQCTPCSNHMICVGGHCDSCKCTSGTCVLVVHSSTCVGGGCC